MVAFGNNHHFQLGTGNKENVVNPTVVFENVNIAKICQGCSHSLILTTLGEVFGAGDNSRGQLGLGEEPKAKIWKSIMKERRIRSIECGYAHTIIQKENGVIEGMGYNEFNQTGIVCISLLASVARNNSTVFWFYN